MSDTVYGYFKANTIEGTGYICVRLDRPPKGVEGEYKATYSFCSPLDQFNRKLARRIADSRMKTPRKECSVSFTSESKKTKDLMEKAVGKLALTEIPRWLRSFISIERVYRSRNKLSLPPNIKALSA